MKTIPVEQLDARLTKAIEQQDQHEAIGLTKDAGTVAWLVRVPPELRDAEADAVLITEGADGHVFVVVQAKHVKGSMAGMKRAAVFGAGRGTLTVLNEDDEHLKDFREYME